MSFAVKISKCINMHLECSNYVTGTNLIDTPMDLATLAILLLSDAVEKIPEKLVVMKFVLINRP